METVKEYCARRKNEIKDMLSKLNTKLKLVVVQVGNVEASNRYVRNKIKDAQECGIEATLLHYDENISEEELLQTLHVLNNDETVIGYLVQLPLPKHIDENKVKLAIDPKKDVDGFHPMAIAVPATPLGVYLYLKDQGFKFTGKNAVVIGRSNIVGKPMAKLLLNESMNVTVLHSKTSDEDKRFFVNHADLIVVATGHRHTLDNSYSYKPECVIMDVGINFNDEGKLCGDAEGDLPVMFKSPVPGGCGLLTRLSVIENLVKLFEANR